MLLQGLPLYPISLSTLQAPQLPPQLVSLDIGQIFTALAQPDSRGSGAAGNLRCQADGVSGSERLGCRLPVRLEVESSPSSSAELSLFFGIPH